MFSTVRKIHFVGIGGIGMSGIAEILLDQGFKITGSDKQLSDITERLANLGAKIYEGHSPEHVEPDVDVVVYSSAVKLDNPEIQEAMRRKIPVIRRAEMLAELMRLKYGIGVAGTHGKTTTTSMVGLVLIEGGFDPTVVVGGVLRDLGGTNARLGHGDFIVVEADEFDKSFLQLTPTIAVITTLEPEHLDSYGNVEELKSAFVDFANKVPFYGFVVLCLDEPMIQDIMPRIKKRVITYGLNAQADVQAIEPKFEERRSSYTLIYKGKNCGRVNLQVPGLHNVKNSLAAIAVGMELGIDLDRIKNALGKFRGVYRRFEIRAEVNGIIVVDDYAHHPTEIKAVLQAAKDSWKRHVIAVFQPHLYSRTRDFYQEFGRSFFNADVCVITDVYPAREEPIEGVTGELIANSARNFGHKEVHYVQDKTEIPDYVLKLVSPGDMVIFMGAGDITKICGDFIKKLREKFKDD
ncbi:UDP-N-acetylmuramate--L-alanine ligase [Candidatus Kryptonium thompsonii]|uniref:UDP-N-acetylmuramate--L-alanine ligase n=1 Tax=Candidatus Kryptonium thompsonii TaxID=1633631 RepID=UPI00063ED067|nr:UDP-N-acetylmuramate--L-alanine ligase [Candidatus Kryptonium thompsoni]CUS79283.1 UDP-N-acetylmuramate--L-alanine ligase [Candidatus Kryptonium thompsoni]CUS83655.1 UDP-N-acetylmuramate--L-alanine ligase [Candidatus Kryptonium thompsoni]CUS99951.1 UDP-N-acetylmuramate--L-alanine ligase [Candidatus Kryptonium thompsoni]